MAMAIPIATRWNKMNAKAQAAFYLYSIHSFQHFQI